jgi:hypothetical protein
MMTLRPFPVIARPAGLAGPIMIQRTIGAHGWNRSEATVTIKYFGDYYPLNSGQLCGSVAKHSLSLEELWWQRSRNMPPEETINLLEIDLESS